MPVIIYAYASGDRREVEAEAGTSVMQTAVDNLVPGIIGECGGELSCATCHVFVDERWADRFPPISDDETDMLDVAAAEPTPYSRLSCQLKLIDDVSGAVVHVPEEQ